MKKRKELQEKKKRIARKKEEDREMRNVAVGTFLEVEDESVTAICLCV